MNTVLLAWICALASAALCCFGVMFAWFTIRGVGWKARPRVQGHPQEIDFLTATISILTGFVYFARTLDFTAGGGTQFSMNRYYYLDYTFLCPFIVLDLLLILESADGAPRADLSNAARSIPYKLPFVGSMFIILVIAVLSFVVDSPEKWVYFWVGCLLFAIYSYFMYKECMKAKERLPETAQLDAQRAFVIFFGFADGIFWPMFPVLWLFSFQGLGIIAGDKDPGGAGEEVFIILHAILDVVCKSVFGVFMMRVRLHVEDYATDIAEKQKKEVEKANKETQEHASTRKGGRTFFVPAEYESEVEEDELSHRERTRRQLLRASRYRHISEAVPHRIVYVPTYAEPGGEFLAPRRGPPALEHGAALGDAPRVHQVHAPPPVVMDAFEMQGGPTATGRAAGHFGPPLAQAQAGQPQFATRGTVHMGSVSGRGTIEDEDSSDVYVGAAGPRSGMGREGPPRPAAGVQDASRVMVIPAGEPGTMLVDTSHVGQARQQNRRLEVDDLDGDSSSEKLSHRDSGRGPWEERDGDDPGVGRRPSVGSRRNRRSHRRGHSSGAASYGSRGSRRSRSIGPGPRSRSRGPVSARQVAVTLDAEHLSEDEDAVVAVPYRQDVRRVLLRVHVHVDGERVELVVREGDDVGEIVARLGDERGLSRRKQARLETMVRQQLLNAHR